MQKEQELLLTRQGRGVSRNKSRLTLNTKSLSAGMVNEEQAKVSGFFSRLALAQGPYNGRAISVLVQFKETGLLIEYLHKARFFHCKQPMDFLMCSQTSN